MIKKNILLDDIGRFTFTFDSEVERFTFFIMNTSGDYLDENCTWNADKNLFEMQPLYPYRKNTGEIRFTINSRIIQYLNNLRDQAFRAEFMADGEPFARTVRSSGTFAVNELPVLHDKYEFTLAEGGKYEAPLDEQDASSVDFTGEESLNSSEFGCGPAGATGEFTEASTGADAGSSEDISSGDSEDAGTEKPVEDTIPPVESGESSLSGNGSESGDIRFLKIKMEPEIPENKSRAGYLLKGSMWIAFLIAVLLLIYFVIVR